MNPTPHQPEAGYEHLRRALAALPEHTPDDTTLWPRISSQLAIEQATHALPDHTPDPELWDHISAQLDPPEPPPAFTQLPAHTPDDALWDAIAARLAAPTNPPALVVPRPWWLRARGRTRPRTVLAAVALLVLVTVGWWQWPLHSAPLLASAPPDTISYDVEVVTEALPAPVASPSLAPDALGRQGEAFIDAHCSSLPTVCQSARFQELRGQLDALETEEARLTDDLRRFGSQPELLRHQSRVTTQKAATTRALIDLLIS